GGRAGVVAAVVRALAVPVVVPVLVARGVVACVALVEVVVGPAPVPGVVGPLVVRIAGTGPALLRSRRPALLVGVAVAGHGDGAAAGRVVAVAHVGEPSGWRRRWSSQACNMIAAAPLSATLRRAGALRPAAARSRSAVTVL